MPCQTDPLQLLSLSQAAELLACSERHAHHLVATGQIPSCRIGTARGLRVRRVDLDRYLNKRTGYHVDERHSTRMKQVWLEQGKGKDGHLRAANKRRRAS